MYKIKNCIFFKYFSIVLSLIFFNVSLSYADTTKLRFAHVHAPSGPTGQGVEKFAQLVKKYSNGHVEIEIFPSSQLGGNKKILGATRSGAVDIGLLPYPLMADIVPSFGVLVSGYVFESWEHQKKVLNHENLGVKWSKQLAEKGGLRILSNYYFGSRTLTTTKTPVYSPKDLKGKKIRAVPNPISLETVTGMGATPTPVPFSELFQALSQGVVDGQENPLPTIFAKKFYDVQKFLVMTKHQSIPIPFAINEKKWSTLSSNDKKAILKAAKEACDWTTNTVQKQEKELTKTLSELGMTVIDSNSGLDLKSFKKSVGDSVKNLDGKIWPAGLLKTVKSMAKK